jgi:hypothetical protein
VTETQLKEKAFAWFRASLPGAFVQKLSDRFAHGVPDCAVTYHGPTTWIEMKVVPPGRTLRAVTKPIQVAVCQRIERASRGHCWFLVRTPDTFELVRPSEFPRPFYVADTLPEALGFAFADTGALREAPTDPATRRAVRRDLRIGCQGGPPSPGPMESC